MQIRISWQALTAGLIFLVALAVAGRALLGAIAPAGPATTAAALATPAPPTAAPAPPTAAPAPPTAAPAPPTAAATATGEPRPTATSPPPPTLAPTPTVAPTRAPEAVAVVAQGFVQDGASLTYAFTARNPNPDLIARDLRYQLIAYNDAGAVLSSDEGGITLIGPQAQTAAAGELTLPEGFRVAQITVVLGGTNYVQAAPLAQLVVANLAFVPGEAPAVTGIVRNPYEQDLEELPVVAIVYDGGGAIIGAGSAALPFVPAGGEAAAVVPVRVAGEPSAIELYPRVSTILTP